jgi:signal transduction histidine kinase
VPDDPQDRLLDVISEAVFQLEPDTGRILHLNRAAADMVGLPRSALLGTSFWGLVDGVRPDQGAETDDRDPIWAPVLDGRLESRTISLFLRRPTGGPRPVEVVLKRVDSPDATAALVAIARDTRERIDAQARLRRLAEAEHTRAAELNAVIRTIGDGVIVCDREGRITLANPAGQDLFPTVAETSYGDILAELQDPDGVAPRLGHRAGPVVLAARSDPDRWIEVTTYPVTGASGAPPDGGGETIVVLRDVTASRKREAVRETFMGVLSHELRTPVTTIYGGSKLLSRMNSTLDEATRRAIFTDIADEAERLQRLVEDIVALNRFGEDGGELGQEPVLLQRIVPVVVRSEESRWPGVSIQIKMPAGLPTVVADPTYVEQAIRNLLSNAAKYSGPRATVEIALETSEDEVELRVLDDGPGIDAHEAERLFEIFYRSARTSTGTSGAGIGLFVCARLVQAMGGRVWARPRPAGGAEFGFALRVMPDD